MLREDPYGHWVESASLQPLVLSATHIILKIEYKSRLCLKKEKEKKMRLQFGTNLG
jgi:hypothetical protein